MNLVCPGPYQPKAHQPKARLYSHHYVHSGKSIGAYYVKLILSSRVLFVS